MKLIHTAKKLLLPNPKTVVAMQTDSNVLVHSQDIEHLAKHSFKNFIWDVAYMYSYDMNDTWVAQQHLLRYKKQKINIVFHISEAIDLLALAAIGSTYPVYLNKYAKIDFKTYSRLPIEHRSDIRVMLGRQAQYREFLHISEEDEKKLPAIEAQSMKLITGIGDSYFTKVIASALLPQSKEVEDTKFLSVNDIYHDYIN